MNRFLPIASTCLLASLACAAQPMPTQESVPTPAQLATPAVAAKPQLARPAEPLPAKRPPAIRACGIRVEAANRSATREPSTAAYLHAMQVYAYAPGALYRLYAAPERVTDIALQPGEAVIAVASGDTVRWTVGDTTSGSGSDRQVHVLVKPFMAGLATNLIITTDRRTYHLSLVSTASAAMASITWTYPQDQLLAVRKPAEVEAPSRPVAAGVAVDQLRFDYRIDGDNPSWRPLRAFDDGRQTFIEFPATIAVGEAPPLFLIGSEGQTQLVNYRQSGRFYVVDRLFDAAELRLGGKRQAVVRIIRGADQLPPRQGRAS